MERPDLIIIGGGAASFAAATKAADLEKRVLMINDGLPLGGTCVNVGCVPSKFLLEALKEHQTANGAGPGWAESPTPLAWETLRQEMDHLVTRLRGLNYHDVIGALGNVSLVEGRARILAPDTVEVQGERFTADRLLIATGGRTHIPDVPGLREADPLTNVTALKLERLPERIGIIGAGPLGLEFAEIFQRAGDGRTRVTLIGRVLPGAEPEVQEEVVRQVKAKGIRIHAGARVVRVSRSAGGWMLHDSAGKTAAVDAIFSATGIQGNTEGLGLEEIGVDTFGRGFIATDRSLQTNVKGVYAAGDVTKWMPLETTAAKQGARAAEHAFTDTAQPLDRDQVPHAVFTDPQVAMVGWTEAREMDELGSCLCRTLPLEMVPRAQASRDTRGLVKLVIHPKTRRILGAHAVARDAAELIHIPTMAIRAGFTIDDLIETVHVFPTYAEAWKMCAQSFDRSLDSMSCCIV